MKIIFLSLLIFFAFCLAGFFIFFLKKKRNEKILRALEMVLLEIKMPKYEKKEKELKEFLMMMEQVFASFLGISRQKAVRKRPYIVFEIASQIGGEDIGFYLAVPRVLQNDAEKYIHGVYPQAVVEEIPQDYTVFEPGACTSASVLLQKETPFLPISTYQNLAQDPLSAIATALTKISVNEGAAFQLVLKPFGYSKFVKAGHKLIYHLKKGEKFEVALREAKKSEFRENIEKLFFPKKDEEEKFTQISPPVDEILIQGVTSKIQKPLFEVNLRLVASAKTKERADDILTHLEASFDQFSGQNSFQVKRIPQNKLKNFVFNFSFREFNTKEKVILNLEELASIFHFPTPYLETPSVKWVRATFAPPPNLPTFGEIKIGSVIFRNEIKPVYFASREDRRRHFYIIGQTGTGKTSLLREMIRQDIEKGEGVGVIDPHGELVEYTLANIPKERIDDVVLFEPFDLNYPMGLNMLEYETPEEMDFAVQEMIAIFHKLFPPEIIGPMFEHYMRNAMLAIMSDRENPGTLVEIPRIFTDDAFMREKLKKVTNPLVRLFWEREWRQTTGQTRSDMLGYVVSKVGRFVENDMMRNIIGQSRSSFNFRQIMDQGKIFLANLSKGLTGEVNSSLLGLILVSKMQMAAMKRADMLPEKRKDFYLYIDEFQNFTTDSIATILSEARKYRLNLILAHQYIPQLPEPIKNAVLGNVGSIGVFRIGPEDAEFLEKEFAPEFSKYDLMNLDNFNLIVKLMVNGNISSPFRMVTEKPKEGDYQIVDQIKKISKMKYGRKKEIVEKEIWERSKLAKV